MLILILGVLLWAGAHLFKRVLPDRRAAMGDKGKGVVALSLLAAVVLMVIGYRMAAVVPLWAGPAWLVHLNNLAVLVALYLMSPAPKKGALLHGMRHPMLTGFLLWAGAHLLVNGDLASLILFGGLGLWAIVEIAVINRAEPAWTPPAKGRLVLDAAFFAASLVLLVAIGVVHGLIGPSPFPG